MSRPHENDENDVSFSIKTQTFENALQSGKIWIATVSASCGRVDGSNSLKTQTLENDWSCDLRPSPLSFEKSKMEALSTENVFFYFFYWYLAPIKLDCKLVVERLRS